MSLLCKCNTQAYAIWITLCNVTSYHIVYFVAVNYTPEAVLLLVP